MTTATTAPSGIVLSTPVNLRDLGGIPIAGGTLRTGFAIRTDDLAYVTADYAAELVDAGLTAIIDLRSPLEVATTGRGPLGEHGVSYHHVPLMSDIGASVHDGALTHESMGTMYARMVESAAPQLVSALNVIAHTPGTTAFHCAAGRDRTGVLAALLLLVLDASDEDIIADYSRTGENMPAIMKRTRPVLGAMWTALGVDPDVLTSTSGLLEGSMSVSMRMLLDALRERHGDALAPLRAAGLTGDTIGRLRARALAA